MVRFGQRPRNRSRWAWEAGEPGATIRQGDPTTTTEEKIQEFMSSRAKGIAQDMVGGFI
jgi:hypothetical protein